MVSKKVNRNKHKVEKWMTKGLIISRNIKNKLRLKSLKFPTLTYIKEYKQYRNLYNCLIRKTKEMHINQELEKSKKKSRKTWAILNEIRKEPKNQTQSVKF